MPAVQRGAQPAWGPVLGLVGGLCLLGVLEAGVGLTAAGWSVGVACVVGTSALLARGLVRSGADRLGPADRVTLARAMVVASVAALTAEAIAGSGAGSGAGSAAASAAQPVLVPLAGVALSLDAVDGWVARRSGTASPLGARFDMEVDAFLILVLSVWVAPAVGAWVLLIGAARYLLAGAELVLPWLRRPVPPRYWRKVVAAIQGVSLTTVAAGVLPPAAAEATLALALLLLAESFGRDIWVLAAGRPRGQHPVEQGGAAVVRVPSHR